MVSMEVELHIMLLLDMGQDDAASQLLDLKAVPKTGVDVLPVEEADR